MLDSYFALLLLGSCFLQLEYLQILEEEYQLQIEIADLPFDLKLLLPWVR
jgi:hypothetical protein